MGNGLYRSFVLPLLFMVGNLKSNISSTKCGRLIVAPSDENRNAHFDGSRVADLGTIKVKIYRAKITRRETQTQNWNQNAVLSGSSSIPEKALKGRATSHRARLVWTWFELNCMVIMPQS